MSDDEEYEFEYSDAEDEAMVGGEGMDEDDPAVRIENMYYNSKGLLGADNAGAEAGFVDVLKLADEQGTSSGPYGEWGFKATKQLVKLTCRAGRVADMLARYTDLLTRINRGDVTRNRAEKAINTILDLVSSTAEAAAGAASSSSSSAAASSADVAASTGEAGAADGAAVGGSASGGGGSLLQEFYRTTLEALEGGGGNERLSFKTRLKLARLYVAQADWERLAPLLRQLQDAALGPAKGAGAGASSGGGDSDDRSRATQALEVFALQIQMYTETRDMKRLAATYKRALSAARTAVPHPAITGVIHECGGKLHMRDRDWDGARMEFMAAFKAFEEAGSGAKTIGCLKYLLLANMLSNSRINPFDSQDTKAYERDPAIAAMTELTSAYLARDIAAFEPVLRRAGSSGGGGGGAGAGAGSARPSSTATTAGGGGGDDLAADEFMRGYLDDLLGGIRRQVLLARVAPYAAVRLGWLAGELNVSAGEAEALAVAVIQDGSLPGAAVDQVAGVLHLRPPTPADAPVVPFGAAALAKAAEAAAAAAAAEGGAVATSVDGVMIDAAGAAAAAAAAKARAAATPPYRDVERLADALRGVVASLSAAAGLSTAATA